MVESQNKFWMAAAAAGAVIGVALIFHYATSGDDDESSFTIEPADEGKLVADLEAAGLKEVKRSAQGMLDSQYFLKLLQFIGQTTRGRTKDVRKQCQEDRRKHFKVEDWENYESIIKKALEVEDQAALLIMNEIVSFLQISEQEFQMTHQMLASNEKTAELVMAAQQGKLQPAAKGEPKLSKQKTLEVFETSQELTMEAMRDMQKRQTPENGDQMQMMVTVMVDQAKMQDKMFFKTGVENEEFEEALVYFVQKDPDVAKAMEKYMMKMRSEMQKAGMGGMPGQ